MVFWDTLEPVSIFRTYWDLSILVLLCYISLMEPYIVCFGITLEPWSVVSIIENTTIGFFAFDVYFNFRTAYHDGQVNLRSLLLNLWYSTIDRK